ncbi:hypothetical protein DOTSEDRAFT_72795 [Dothistroma septosporum NZE10]|uniref:Uncharacterized protein n=1 Tax=Dothistroma septosporum (strain NZE10 / CBS 128990) TaxID=675120 RepID=M2YPJ0_DOTSN|nr:hypothetical protein DOTSEDRAFT_72795 [Dothistroma septosporum NZE10]
MSGWMNDSVGGRWEPRQAAEQGVCQQQNPADKMIIVPPRAPVYQTALEPGTKLAVHPHEHLQTAGTLAMLARHHAETTRRGSNIQMCGTNIWRSSKA